MCLITFTKASYHLKRDFPFCIYPFYLFQFFYLNLLTGHKKHEIKPQQGPSACPGGSHQCECVDMSMRCWPQSYCLKNMHSWDRDGLKNKMGDVQDADTRGPRWYNQSALVEWQSRIFLYIKDQGIIYDKCLVSLKNLKLLTSGSLASLDWLRLFQK